MNHPVKGYFCLVQYCPDLARREVANVGVLLFSPEHDFLEVRLVNNNHRVRRFFGEHAEHAKHVKAMKEAFTQRLLAEKREFSTLEDLCGFVQTRANRILLTQPKAVRVVDPAADLEGLFATLVDEPSSDELVSADLTLRERLDNALGKPELASKIRQSLRVEVPLLKREVKVPFGYQNGRFNLIQPVSFAQKTLTGVTNAATFRAVEGNSLFHHKDSELGELQLVVVGDFRKGDEEGIRAVTEMLNVYKVKLYTSDSLGELEHEIRMHGREFAL